jgi:hypothetical protein
MLPRKMPLGSGWEGRLGSSGLPGAGRLHHRLGAMPAAVLDQPDLVDRQFDPDRRVRQPLIGG